MAISLESSTEHDNFIKPDSEFKHSRIEVFTLPEYEKAIESSNAAELTKLLKIDAKTKVQPRVGRMLATLFGLLLILFVVLYTNYNFSFTRVISIWLGSIFVFYFIHILGYLLTAKYAYRVYSINGIIKNDWINMPITSRALIYRYEPINSVSEFSAIGGGIANQLLIMISTISYCVVMIIFITHTWYHKTALDYMKNTFCCQKTKLDLIHIPNGISIICQLIGTFGLAQLSAFELDPYSTFLRNAHMIGVYLGFGCPIGYIIQQWYEHEFTDYATLPVELLNDNEFGKPVSILLLVIAFIFFLIWTQYYNRKSDQIVAKYKKEEIIDSEKLQKEIKHLTRMNIITEAITLMCASLTLCLWIYSFDDKTPVYYRDNFIDNNDVIPLLPYAKGYGLYYSWIAQAYKCDLTVIDPGCGD